MGSSSRQHKWLEIFHSERMAAEDAGRPWLNINFVRSNSAEISSPTPMEFSDFWCFDKVENSLTAMTLKDVVHLRSPFLPFTQPEHVKGWQEAFSKAHVTLVGVTHYEVESMKRTSAVVRLIQPDVLMVELCPRRLEYLSKSHEEFHSAKGAAETLLGFIGSALGDMDEKKTTAQILSALEPSIDSERIENFLRKEFWDRETDEIVKKTWEFFSAEKDRILQFQEESTRMMNTTADVTVLAGQYEEYRRQLKQISPQLYPLMNTMAQRERHMVNTLRTLLHRFTIEKFAACPAATIFCPLTIVGVVGAAHIPGIRLLWDQSLGRPV